MSRKCSSAALLPLCVVVVVECFCPAAAFPLLFRLHARETHANEFAILHASGPKAQGHRRRSRESSITDSKGPKSNPSRRHRQPEPALFDGKSLSKEQDPNEDAPSLDLQALLNSEESVIRCLTPEITFQQPVKLPTFTFLSLDDLFPDLPGLGLSRIFNQDSNFRQQLRMAIRQDIFDTTPFYANLSEKAASVMLLPDSSLEGSWRMPDSMDRMTKTTQVLLDVLGNSEAVPSGDDLFRAIGKLCGSKASTHWIDIFGVQDRKISHSWHLDFGASSITDSRTVLWGFPPEDNYQGCGVFSHLVPLAKECVAPEDQPRMEPILFDGSVPDRHIVRPKYAPGRELVFYRDIDLLHSAPDVTYRSSVMRFM